MTRSTVLAGAVLVAVLLTASCGGPGTPPSDGDGSPTPTPTLTPTPHPTPTGSSTSPPDDPDDGGFPYVPWGPDDPPIPTQYAVLAASADQPPRCDELADVDDPAIDHDFWRTAASVCRAITRGGPWPDTTSVPDPPAARNDYQACLDDELATMLGAALAWHADHPDQQPEVTYASGGDTSPCQYRIYTVRVLTADDAVDPAEHEPDAVALAVTASDVDGDAQVHVDGQPAEPTGDYDVDDPGDGLTTLVVRVPAPEQPRTAAVEVSTDREPLVTEVELPGADVPVTPSPTEEPPEETPTEEPPSEAPPSEESPTDDSAGTGTP